MRTIRIIWKRELAACFLSPIAYVMMVAFVFVTGATFLVAAFKNEGRPEPLPLYLFGADAMWLPVLIGVVSMRLFAEERRSGTLENLLTVPVSEFQIVVGKYLGALTSLLLVLAPTVLSVFILERLSPGIEPADLDSGAFICGGVMLLCICILFTSVGTFCSLLTRNQIVAAVVSICLLWFLLLFGWILKSVPDVPPALADYLSVTVHIEDWSRGSADLRNLVLYGSATCFMLFCSVRILESRRWKP